MSENQSTKSQAHKSFAAAKKAVTAEQLKSATTAIENAYDKRAKFEIAKGKGPEHKIHASLAASKKHLLQEGALRTLIAAGVDADFINSTTNEGSAFNVYAAQKLSDLVVALDTGIMKNAINNAVTRSLFAFKNANEAFTGELARAAVSDKIRIQGQIAKLLVRHTVDAATAPTQMSSTMSALGVLGIVENKGTRRAPVYGVTGSLAAKRLEEVVTPKAA